jgi:hypothetical protein
MSQLVQEWSSFEEKKPKTSALAHMPAGSTMPSGKSFLVLFFKKERFFFARRASEHKRARR